MNADNNQKGNKVPQFFNEILTKNCLLRTLSINI